jgi:hypothetical protein
VTNQLPMRSDHCMRQAGFQPFSVVVTSGSTNRCLPVNGAQLDWQIGKRYPAALRQDRNAHHLW